MRERIDVSEIEAQTKIRAKYLRALENEEWDLLPGPTFVKSFLRTYAAALGLDGKALVEEFRLHFERPSEPPEPIGAAPRRVRVPRAAARQGAGGVVGRPSRGYLALAGLVGVLILLLIVGLLSGGGGKGGSTTGQSAATSARTHRAGHGRGSASAAHHGGSAFAGGTAVSLSLRATGAVYVCLIGENGRKLVPGSTLEEGQRTPTFHARHFELTLGNNAVVLTVDGTPRPVPASESAIGYSITKAGRRTLAPGHLPTCA